MDLVILLLILAVGLFLISRGEKKELGESLEVERELSNYNALSAGERTAQMKSWIAQGMELERICGERSRKEYDAYRRREETAIGMIANRVNYENFTKLAGPTVEKAFQFGDNDERRLRILKWILRRATRPRGLTMKEREWLDRF